MIIFQYRWRLPAKKQKCFSHDWENLTKKVAANMGVMKAALYQSDCGDYIAIAKWSSIDAWLSWKKNLSDHPLRRKYRKYRISGPEILSPLVIVTGTKTKR